MIALASPESASQAVLPSYESRAARICRPLPAPLHTRIGSSFEAGAAAAGEPGAGASVAAAASVGGDSAGVSDSAEGGAAFGFSSRTLPLGYVCLRYA